MPEDFTTVDIEHLRAVFHACGVAAREGRLPFAARLVDAQGTARLLAENDIQRSGDATAHAEMVLLRQATAEFSRDELASMTLYAAAEPCAMCAGAIVWSGVGRIVYGLSSQRIRIADPLPAGRVRPGVSGRTVLEATVHGPMVIGPVLEDEAQGAMFAPQVARPTEIRWM